MIPEWLNQHPFYNLRFYREGNYFITVRHDNELNRIAITDIDRVTIYHLGLTSTGKVNCWIHLISDIRVSVPTVVSNFEELKTYLFQLSDFDKEKYLQILTEGKEINETLLYKRKKLSNYKLFENTNIKKESLEKGILIENKKIILPWGNYMDIEILADQKKKNSYTNSSYFSETYTFNEVQLFGSLHLPFLATQTDSTNRYLKKELPVLFYFSSINVSNTKKDFFSIASFLHHYFQDNRPLTIEENNNLLYEYQQDTITVHLSAYYDSLLQDYNDSLYFTINKKIDETPYYINEYQQKLDLKDIEYIVLNTSIIIKENYRDNDKIIYTPPGFQNIITKDNSLCWKDQKNNYLGIANEQFAQLFPLNQLKRITLAIQNFRGSEGINNLEIDTGTEQSNTISICNTADFISSVSDLKKLLNIKVNHYVYNDHY